MKATEPPATAHEAESDRPFVHILAGIGGLVFVAMIILQNAIRSSEPGFAAKPGNVVSYFAANRVAVIVPLGLYPIGMIGLLFFVAGIRSHATDIVKRWWADVGTFAVIVIAALFGVVNIAEIAIAADGSTIGASHPAIQGLWSVHAAAFGLNLVAIGIALVGLSQAALGSHLIPRWFATVALIGGACLLVASIFTVAITDGGAWLYLGFLGFIVWGVFLVIAGINLIRGRHRSPREDDVLVEASALS